MNVDLIYTGDCLSILKDFPDYSIDLILTSPPYDKMRKYGGHDFTFSEAYPQAFLRLLKEGGVCVWVVRDETIEGSETLSSFQQALAFKQVGFKVHDTMIYEKLNGMPLNHNRYEQKFEYMFVFSKGKPKTFNPLFEVCIGAGKENTGGARSYTASSKEISANSGGWGYGNKIKETKIRSNVWKYYTGSGHSTTDTLAFKHPATFPEQLAEDHILSWTNKNELVLDPMCGSGTSCVVARKLCRRYIGIDINPEYTTISKKRLSKIPAYLVAS
jgi:DNA modification methylase